MNRQEALEKAAQMLAEAEGSLGEQHLSKQLTLAQLYMSLAHEIGAGNA